MRADPPKAAAVLGGGALLVVRTWHIGSPAANLLSSAVASVGVFAGTLMLTALDREDREFIRQIRARLMESRFAVRR